MLWVDRGHFYLIISPELFVLSISTVSLSEMASVTAWTPRGNSWLCSWLISCEYALWNYKYPHVPPIKQFQWITKLAIVIESSIASVIILDPQHCHLFSLSFPCHCVHTEQRQEVLPHPAQLRPAPWKAAPTQLESDSLTQESQTPNKCTLQPLINVRTQSKYRCCIECLIMYLSSLFVYLYNCANICFYVFSILSCK